MCDDRADGYWRRLGPTSARCLRRSLKLSLWRRSRLNLPLELLVDGGVLRELRSKGEWNWVKRVRRRKEDVAK